MSLLDGGLARAFAGAFGALYLDGTLHRITSARASNGDITSTEADTPIKGQVDTCTEAQKREDGYTDRDARLLVLQVGPTGVTISRPNTDAKVTLAGTKWLLQSVTSDPANTYWDLRARPE